MNSAVSETTYSNLRENLSSFLDRVVEDQDVIIVRRKDGRDVALIPASELSGLIETANLLRSPANAKRLLTALKRAKRGASKPSSIESLRKDIWLGSGR